jgi:hypothetical protein
VQAGDKIGLVGRNGAGKTTPHADPRRVPITGRRNGDPFGQSRILLAGGGAPRPRVPRDDRPGANPRGSGDRCDAAPDRGDPAQDRAAGRRCPRPGDRAIRQAPGRVRGEGGFVAEAEAKRTAANLGIDNDDLDQPVATMSGWPAPARRAGQDPLRRDVGDAAGRADQPSRSRRQGVVGRVLVVISGALCLSSPTISRCSTRRSPVGAGAREPEDRAIQRQLQLLPRRARAPAGAAREGAQAPAPEDRGAGGERPPLQGFDREDGASGAVDGDSRRAVEARSRGGAGDAAKT